MKRVYISGVFDLLHIAHVRAIKRARQEGSYLIVGVLNDRDTQSYKRRPVVPYRHRRQLVNALHCVDEVIRAPLFPTPEFYSSRQIDLQVQDQDDTSALDFYQVPKRLGIIKFVGRDKTVSTSELLRKSSIVYLNQPVERLTDAANSNTVLGFPSSGSVVKFFSKSDLGTSVADNMRRLGNRGIETLNYTSNCCGRLAICDYADGYDIFDRTSHSLADLIKVLHELHSSGVVFAISGIRSLVQQFVTKSTELLKIEPLLLEIESCHSPLVPCHVDLVPGNILVPAIGKPVLIDWEYARNLHCESDLASLALSNEFPIDRVSEEYPQNTDQRLATIYAAVLSFVWGNWHIERGLSDTSQKKAYFSCYEMYLRQLAGLKTKSVNR